MIRVVRITGESFDLETGAQMPKALVLSNGLREFTLHVDDDTALAVVEMMVEGHQPRDGSPRVPGNGSSAGFKFEKPAEPEFDKAPEPQIQRMVQVVDTPSDDDFEEESLEPGEEYNDPATGAGSL